MELLCGVVGSHFNDDDDVLGRGACGLKLTLVNQEVERGDRFLGDATRRPDAEIKGNSQKRKADFIFCHQRLKTV